MGAIIRKNNSAAILKRIEGALDVELKVAAEETQADAVKRVEGGPKTGKVYRRGAVKRTLKTGGKKANELLAIGLRGMENESTGKTKFIVGWKYHRASREGEAPATDTGNLAGSIQVVKLRELSWLVGVGAEYGAALEIGLNRPFLYPAYRQAAARLKRRIRTRLRSGSGRV